VNPLFTIGHSNLELDDIRSNLRNYGVDTVVDVRSQPFSRYSPHFNRAELAHSLGSSGFGYEFEGERLGGRPGDARYYDGEGYVRYDLWSESVEFQAGLSRLLELAKSSSVALLCSEEDPARCHRHLLIARVLKDEGVAGDQILHIRASGELTADDDIPLQMDLFGGSDTWRSPQSVLHKVQPSSSSRGYERHEYAD
jgi:uncharacterized protein (DUF488 family)